MSNKTFSIRDVSGYATKMRLEAAISIVDQDIQIENLDTYITLPQTIRLINDNSLGKDNDNHPLIDEDTNEKIFRDVATWIYNIALAKLAAEDKIECAWSTKENNMIFWNKIPELDEAQSDQPKPKSKRRRKNL